MVKTDEEILFLKEAATQGALAFNAIGQLLADNGEGKSEQRLHYEAQGVLRDFGNRDLSFDPILAINANAAKAHALPTQTVLKRGDLVLLDAGVKYRRFCSDRTRTFLFGNDISMQKDQHFSNREIQSLYDLVRKAQETAISKARAGMQAKELDSIARSIIDTAGYGKAFSHSLGHGVGLDIHEHPYINTRNSEILEDSMVFTIEPGVYLGGKFGIRIEDTVVIKNGRAEVL